MYNFISPSHSSLTSPALEDNNMDNMMVMIRKIYLHNKWEKMFILFSHSPVGSQDFTGLVESVLVEINLF